MSKKQQCMIADKIKSKIMTFFSIHKGCACVDEFQIGDLAYDLGYKNKEYHRRPDLWIVDLYGKITIIEVKSSRADFVSDKKWETYRNFCDLFYFAIDGDYVDKDELPKGVGLIKLDDSKRGFHYARKAGKNKNFKLTDKCRTHLYFRMFRSLSNRQKLVKRGSK